MAFGETEGRPPAAEGRGGAGALASRGPRARGCAVMLIRAMPLRVKVVTAEREVLSEDAADMVVAPGAEGVLGILPRHAPLLTTLQPGIIRVKKGGSEESMVVGG